MREIAQIPGIPEQNPNAALPSELRKGTEGLRTPIKKGERFAVDAEGLAQLQKLTEFAGSKFGNEEVVSKQISDASRALQSYSREIDLLKRERQAIMDRSLRTLKAEDRTRLDQISSELALKRYQSLEGRSHRLELLKQRADFDIDPQHLEEYKIEKADAAARAKKDEAESLKEDQDMEEFIRDMIKK